MDKIKIVVYRGNNVVFQKECTSYLMATRGEDTNFGCSIIATSEKNMRHLMAACMASAFEILVQKGVAEEDIDEFFKRAIDEMFKGDQVQHEQVILNETLQ